MAQYKCPMFIHYSQLEIFDWVEKSKVFLWVGFKSRFLLSIFEFSFLHEREEVFVGREVIRVFMIYGYKSIGINGEEEMVYKRKV